MLSPGELVHSDGEFLDDEPQKVKPRRERCAPVPLEARDNAYQARGELGELRDFVSQTLASPGRPSVDHLDGKPPDSAAMKDIPYTAMKDIPMMPPEYAHVPYCLPYGLPYYPAFGVPFDQKASSSSSSDDMEENDMEDDDLHMEVFVEEEVTIEDAPILEAPLEPSTTLSSSHSGSENALSLLAASTASHMGSENALSLLAASTDAWARELFSLSLGTGTHIAHSGDDICAAMARDIQVRLGAEHRGETNDAVPNSPEVAKAEGGSRRAATVAPSTTASPSSKTRSRHGRSAERKSPGRGTSLAPIVEDASESIENDGVAVSVRGSVEGNASTTTVRHETKGDSDAHLRMESLSSRLVQMEVEFRTKVQYLEDQLLKSLTSSAERANELRDLEREHASNVADIEIAHRKTISERDIECRSLIAEMEAKHGAEMYALREKLVLLEQAGESARSKLDGERLFFEQDKAEQKREFEELHAKIRELKAERDQVQKDAQEESARHQKDFEVYQRELGKAASILSSPSAPVVTPSSLTFQVSSEFDLIGTERG